MVGKLRAVVLGQGAWRGKNAGSVPCGCFPKRAPGVSAVCPLGGAGGSVSAGLCGGFAGGVVVGWRVVIRPEFVVGDEVQEGAAPALQGEEEGGHEDEDQDGKGEGEGPAVSPRGVQQEVVDGGVAGKGEEGDGGEFQGVGDEEGELELDEACELVEHPGADEGDYGAVIEE